MAINFLNCKRHAECKEEELKFNEIHNWKSLFFLEFDKKTFKALTDDKVVTE